MDFKKQLKLNEDISLTINSQKKDSKDNKAPKTYGEYLNTQVKNMVQQKADFTKANDAELKKMGKNMATVAKNKFKGLEGLPKNDTEANNMLQSEIAKQQMEADGDGQETEASIQAEKEIDELAKKIQESIDDEVPSKLLSAACVIMDIETLKILGVHSTKEWPRKSHNDEGPWGLPKGQIDDGETSEEAVIREVKEEVGIDIDASKLKHIGIVKYLPVKDLDLFIYNVSSDELNEILSSAKCESMFENKNGYEQPEVDDYKLCSINELGKRYQQAIKSKLGEIFQQ